MNEADLKQVEARIREEIRRMLDCMQEMAHWYTDGYGDLTGSAADMVENMVKRMEGMERLRTDFKKR